MRGPHHQFRLTNDRRPARGVSLLLILAAAAAFAATDAYELLTDQALTPKKFAAYFETFEFEGSRDVQSPGEFLSRRRGDCDDYAILAEHLLSRRGYETRLIHIRLVGRVA